MKKNLRVKILRVLIAGLLLLLCNGISQGGSPNELFEDGGFDSPNIKPNGDTEQGIILEGNNRVFQLVKHGHRFEWDAKTGPIWNTEYILSFRMKGDNLKGSRLCLWNRLPDQHEPPTGPIFSKFHQGTFDWTTEEVRFKMPVGISRFILFLDHQTGGGACRVDDISIRPAVDVPLSLPTDLKQIGSVDREQTCWIWKDNDYFWDPNVGNQNRAFGKPVPETVTLFRRTVTIPADAKNVQAVFCGDDFAVISVDGKVVGQNQCSQDIAKIPLAVKPGRHEFSFRVENHFGPAGLAGRIEWFDAAGKRSPAATNGAWECSADEGKTWKPAEVITVVTPAPTQFHWVYPHLEKLTCRLNYQLPKGAIRPRIAVRATGGCSLTYNNAQPLEGVSAGHVLQAELTPDAAETVSVELTDISQPAVGMGILQYVLDGKTVDVSLEKFTLSTGKAAEIVQASYPGRGWPHNIATFDAASSLPLPEYKNKPQLWTQKVLKNAVPIWSLGQTDDSSEEFAALSKETPLKPVTLPLADTKQCPQGLEGLWHPEQTFQFTVKSLPEKGAAFVLSVEDSDAMVTQVGVFLNGILVGMPQIIGYDQIPGGRKTLRDWVVTIPKERFIQGENILTLRLIPSSYTKKGEVMNQSDEYISMMNLRRRNENPYPTSDWLHWDSLSLIALAQEPVEPINGRPVFMGTNIGYTHLKGFEPFEEYVLRDLAYLGLTHSGSPLRMGVWDRGQYRPLAAEVNGVNVFDLQLNALRKIGIEPLLLFEPGRLCNSWEDFEKSNEVTVIKNHGAKINTLEIGNEVDHPYYGWNQMAMAAAYATIQKQSVMGQALKKYADNPNLRITGEGWYHAWNYSVVDAQARKEAANDPGFTDDLSAHNYGRSYIQPAVQYYSLYGPNLGDPKPIWVTECGSWTPDDTNVFEFDVNLRGNIAYVTYIVQYLLHPYDDEMRRFSLLAENGPNAKTLEKTRIYRRLFQTYALHGKPIPFKILNEAELKDRLVVINPVAVADGIKVALVNFSDKPQTVNVELTLEKSRNFSGKRYGDGETVAAGTRDATLQATPKMVIKESLAPGETILYDCR